MKIDVFTPTYKRPECLKLCQMFVGRQTYPCQHIISEGPDVFRNLLSCIERSDGDAVVIFEDDDWYPDYWVRLCVEKLEEGVSLLGQKIMRLYHVPTGGWENHPVKQVGFQSAAFIGTMRKHLAAVCYQNLWNKRGPEIEKPFSALCPDFELLTGGHVVGMKGMPGTKGYSKKHDASWYSVHDTDRRIIKEWVGKDWKLYRPWFLP